MTLFATLAATLVPTLVVVLVLALGAAVTVALVRAHRTGWRFAEHHFRPAAPLAGVLAGDREAERQLADLRAMRAYRDDSPLL